MTPESSMVDTRDFHIASRLRLSDQPLLLPVLQHLLHLIARHVCPFGGNALLEGSVEAELCVQTLEDGVVTTHTVTLVIAGIVAVLSLFKFSDAKL